MAITLNGDSGITNVNGTAAAPAITGTDTDSGMYFGTNTVALSTSGTAALSIDASQNVGIGTASPISKFQVDSTSATGVTFSRSGGTNANTNVQFKNLTTSFYLGTSATGNFAIKYNDPDLSTSPNLVITANGGLAFGGASNYGTSGQLLQSNGDAAPTWVTAGTPTTLYAIGTYVTGRPQNSTVYAVNDTLAGTSLYAVSDSVVWNYGSNAWRTDNNGSSLSGTQVLVNTGTWRCVSPAGTTPGDLFAFCGLWVRIS